MPEQTNGERQAERDRLEADINASFQASKDLAYGSEQWWSLRNHRDKLEQRLEALERLDALDGLGDDYIVGTGGRTF